MCWQFQFIAPWQVLTWNCPIEHTSESASHAPRKQRMPILILPNTTPPFSTNLIKPNNNPTHSVSVAHTWVLVQDAQCWEPVAVPVLVEQRHLVYEGYL